MSRREQFLELRSASPVILPSILLCDFSNLEREMEALNAAGVRALHLDVMDGRFVPNLTYGMPIVEAFRKLTIKICDLYNMPKLINYQSCYVLHYERFKDIMSSSLSLRTTLFLPTIELLPLTL